MTALGQTYFLQALGWAVLNSLWQLAFLWVLYQIITALFSVRNSASKAKLATTLLFAGFGWFVYTFISILSESGNHSGYAAFATWEANPAANYWIGQLLPVASLLYLALLALPVWNFIRNYRFVQTIRRTGLRKADVQWRMFVRNVAGHMGIRKPVQVWISELVNSPVTIGYLKPVILLPLASVNHLSLHQTEAVLLHELSHIKRFDYLLNLVMRVIQTVLYFNPFVKAFIQIIEREREKSCDEMVIQFQYEPHGYASALLTLEKVANRRGHSLAVAAAGNKKHELLGRIESILGIERKPSVSFARIAGVAAALLCFLSLNVMMIWNRPHTTGIMKADLMAQVVSPNMMFGDEETTSASTEETGTPTSTETKTQTTDVLPIAGLVPTPKSHAGSAESDPEEYSSHNPISDLQFVSSRQTILSKEQENEVKAALEASKRVLEETQWKAVENSIADVLTTAEKSAVREQYEKASDRANWGVIENKLREAYNQIDWPKVQTELDVALAEIKLDSLEHVYKAAIVDLADLKKEMLRVNQKSIPDTDITIKVVENKKREAEKAASRLKAVRERKVIKL